MIRHAMHMTNLNKMKQKHAHTCCVQSMKLPFFLCTYIFIDYLTNSSWPSVLNQHPVTKIWYRNEGQTAMNIKKKKIAH
jgi:hypothetical protein